MEISEKEYQKLKNQAEKYEVLAKKVAEFYCDESGEYSQDNPVRKGDLCDIGEAVAIHFGWM